MDGRRRTEYPKRAGVMLNTKITSVKARSISSHRVYVGNLSKKVTDRKHMNSMLVSDVVRSSIFTIPELKR